MATQTLVSCVNMDQGGDGGGGRPEILNTIRETKYDILYVLCSMKSVDLHLYLFSRLMQSVEECWEETERTEKTPHHNKSVNKTTVGPPPPAQAASCTCCCNKKFFV